MRLSAYELDWLILDDGTRGLAAACKTSERVFVTILLAIAYRQMRG
jgi:hypothetical protein